MSSRLAEPVMRKRPGSRRRSISRFTACSISGARCTSSRVTGPPSPSSTDGSRSAASATSVSSNERKRRASGANSRASVLFPVCRAPLTTTAGMTRKRRSSSFAAIRDSAVFSMHA